MISQRKLKFINKGKISLKVLDKSSRELFDCNNSKFMLIFRNI